MKLSGKDLAFGAGAVAIFLAEKLGPCRLMS